MDDETEVLVSQDLPQQSMGQNGRSGWKGRKASSVGAAVKQVENTGSGTKEGRFRITETSAAIPRSWNFYSAGRRSHRRILE